MAASIEAVPTVRPDGQIPAGEVGTVQIQRRRKARAAGPSCLMLVSDENRERHPNHARYWHGPPNHLRREDLSHRPARTCGVVPVAASTHTSAPK
jgi:hypothetical protein